MESTCDSARGFIYGLIDPRDGTLRYVGQTRNTIRTRLHGHLHDYKKPTRKGKWIAELKALSLKPQATLLASCSLADIDDEEIATIAFMRATGAELYNIADGGGGCGVGVSYDDSDDEQTAAEVADVWDLICPQPAADDPYDDGFPPVDEWTEEDEKRWSEESIQQWEKWDDGRWDDPITNGTPDEHKYAMREED